MPPCIALLAARVHITERQTSHEVVVTNELVRGVETTVVSDVDAEGTEVIERRQLDLVVLTHHFGIRQVVASLKLLTIHTRGTVAQSVVSDLRSRVLRFDSWLGTAVH